MSGRVSALMSGLAIVVVVASIIVVVVFGHMHSAPSLSDAAPSSLTPAAVPAEKALSAAPASSASTAAPLVHAPALSLECIVKRIRQAPAPFHWSFQRNTTGSGTADWEADISSNSIAGTLVDSSGTYPIQAVRTDSSAWNTAVSVLTTPLPMSAFALLRDLPAPAPAAVERVGGAYTVKYLIDTSRRAAAVPSTKNKALEPNGFVNGAVWVNEDGCPVKFVLDVEQQLGDGSVKKEHYAGNAVAEQ
jgi:hypothetical protein